MDEAPVAQASGNENPDPIEEVKVIEEVDKSDESSQYFDAKRRWAMKRNRTRKSDDEAGSIRNMRLVSDVNDLRDFGGQNSPEGPENGFNGEAEAGTGHHDGAQDKIGASDSFDNNTYSDLRGIGQPDHIEGEQQEDDLDNGIGEFADKQGLKMKRDSLMDQINFNPMLQSTPSFKE